MPASWLDCSEGFARREGIEDLLPLLTAFSAPYPRGGALAPPEPAFSGSFEALEAQLETSPRFEELLCADVDPAQAALFARRLMAVLASLGSSPGERLLSVGLRQRLAGILAAPPPRASRVRALADFYYSQAAQLRWQREPGGASLEELAAAARFEPLAPGLAFARLEGRTPDGPLCACVLRVDPSTVQILSLRPAGRRSLPEALAEVGGLAGVTGGFFLYSEPDIAPPAARYDPVGLLVQRGEVVVPPWLRRGALLVAGDRAEIRAVGAADCLIRVQGQELDGRQAWTRARGLVGPDLPSVAIASGQIVAVGRSLPVPLNGAVLPGEGIALGARVAVSPPSIAGVPVTEAMAGGPLLLERGQPVLRMQREDFWGTAPPVTFSQDETGDRNLLPRHAVGLAGDQLLFVAVDGRDFERSLGLTLAGTARLLAALGCSSAVNLDGGSSKRMVVRGQVVDRSSTEVQGVAAATDSVRPVHTALAFVPR